MSMKERKGIVDRQTAAILRCHRLAAAQLPDPDETYRKSDLPKPLQEAFDRFIAHGIIKCADRHGAGERGEIALWRTSRRAARWVDRYVDDLETLPCGHPGLVNYGETYGCARDYCTERFDRETVEDVFGLDTTSWTEGRDVDE